VLRLVRDRPLVRRLDKLVRQEGRIDPAGPAGDSHLVDIPDAVDGGVAGCGPGCRRIGAGAGTDPAEGSPVVLDCSLVAAGRRELGSVAGGLLVVGDCSSPAVVVGSLVLGEVRRRIVDSVDSRRLRRLRSTRCLTLCG
jgi:hypothetical protein